MPSKPLVHHKYPNIVGWNSNEKGTQNQHEVEYKGPTQQQKSRTLYRDRKKKSVMCTVASLNSSVFSPSSRVSSSIFCKSSPESLILTHSPSASSSSPKSSFKFRLQTPLPPASGLIRASNDDGPNSSSSTSSTILKKKRPTRLAIPIAPLSFSSDQSTPCAPAPEDRWKEVEVEGDGYSVREEREM